MSNQVKNYAIVLLAVVALASMLYAWYKPPKVVTSAPQKDFQEASVPKPYAVVTKETVTVETIKVLTKKEVIVKDRWPDWFTSNEAKQVTAIGMVDPYKGKTEVVSVIDIKSGESQIISKRLPLALFAFENEKAIGMRYGTDLIIYGSWTFARVGNMYFAGYAEAGNGRTFVGIDGSYRW
jgi:hypothetical protein